MQHDNMSSEISDSRDIQMSCMGGAGVASLRVQAGPSLPNDILWKIVLFSPSHLRLRLVSSSWSQGVIDAHCDPECGCKTCTCASSLSQFTLKRILLPWMSQWKFTVNPLAIVSPALLNDMMFQQQQNGAHTLRASSSFGNRGLVPISSCEFEVSEAMFPDLEGVVSTVQLQGLKKLSIKVIDPAKLSAANKQKGAKLFGNLKHVEDLELSDWSFAYNTNGGQEDFQSLISSFPNLKHIDATNCQIGELGLSVFASSPSVSRLVALHIVNNPSLTAAAIQASICSSPHLTSLSTLTLSGGKYGDAVVTAICQPHALPGLKQLWLPDCDLRDASILTLISSPKMRNLKSLSLSGNQISAAGLASLFASASKRDAPFSQLDNLHVTTNASFSGAAFRSEIARNFSPLVAEAETPPHRSIACLSLRTGDTNKFDCSAITALSNIPFMQFVRDLELDCADEIAPTVLFSPASQFTALRSLDLSVPRCTWFAINSVACSPLAQELRTLTLASHLMRGDAGFAEHLDDSCCTVLSNATYLGKLEQLNLVVPTMSISVGLVTLLSSSNLPSVTHLDCNFDGADATDYAPTETLTLADAAQKIIHLLQTTATRMEYLRFPKTAFGSAVRALVQKEITSMTLK